MEVLMAQTDPGMSCQVIKPDQVYEEYMEVLIAQSDPEGVTDIEENEEELFTVKEGMNEQDHVDIPDPEGVTDIEESEEIFSPWKKRTKFMKNWKNHANFLKREQLIILKTSCLYF
jgi:hypothetical protein